MIWVLTPEEARGASVVLEPVLGFDLEWPCIAFSTKLVVRASCVEQSPMELSEVDCPGCTRVWQNEGLVAVGCGHMRSLEDLVVPSRVLDVPPLDGCTDGQAVLVHIGVLRMQYPPEEMGTCGVCQLKIGADVCFEYQISLVGRGT